MDNSRKGRLFLKEGTGICWEGGINLAKLHSFDKYWCVEFTPARNNKYLIYGLSDENTNTSAQSIDYGILLAKNQHLAIYENGIDVTPVELEKLKYYNHLVTFQVLRQGNSIVYKRDGVEIYRSESEVDPAVELMVYCAFRDNGATLSDVKWVDEATDYVSWLNEAQLLPGREQLDECGTLSFAFTGVPALVRSITYDAENRLTSLTENGNTTTYYYDAGGQRIKKTENGIETYYFFKNYEEVIESGSTKKIFHYFANGQRIAQRIITNTDNKLLYIHTDHLGSSVKLTNETGETVQVIAYDPYGKTVYYEGGNELSHQFTGQEFEKGTGLYYYGARYYDPALGRFISPDQVMAGPNRYTYCYNNPIMYTDPSGNNPLVYFFVYLAGSYLSGVSGSGSWNPATWSGDVWKSSFLWPLQAVNGVSWSSNGSVDVYYTSGGSGTVYDPGAIAAEQMYYAWKTGFYEQLTEHMRYYTRYYGENSELYCMGNTDYGIGKENKHFDMWIDRFISLLMSNTKQYSVGNALSTLGDAMSVYPSIKNFMIYEKGSALRYEAVFRFTDNCKWNKELARFNLAFGLWLQKYSMGIQHEKSAEYYSEINVNLQQAKDIYYNYLYSLTNSQFVPGIDFKAKDLYYIPCSGPLGGL